MAGYTQRSQQDGHFVVIQNAIPDHQMGILGIQGNRKILDAVECISRQLLQILAQVNRLQGSATGKGTALDGQKAVGQIDLRQSIAFREGVGSNALQILRKLEGLQGVTAGEGTVANDLYRLGNDHGHQGRTSEECIVSDRRQSVGQHHLGQGNRISEHPGNVREGIGDDDLANALEGAHGIGLPLDGFGQGDPFLVTQVGDQHVHAVLLEEAQAVGGFDIGIILVAIMTVAILIYQGLGIGHDTAVIRIRTQREGQVAVVFHRDQAIASIERHGLDGLHAATQGHGRQGAGPAEGASADGDHTVGNGQLHQLGAINEGILTDMGHTLAKIQLGQSVAVAKRRVINDSHAIGQSDRRNTGSV